jgi:hypothetical protein
MKSLRQQKGISLFGLIFFGAILGFIGIVAAQVIPPVNEYLSIKKHINTVKNEGTTVPEIRAKFDATSHVNNIISVKGSDLVVSKENERVKISFAYDRQVHIAGPVFLLIKFSGSSD